MHLTEVNYLCLCLITGTSAIENLPVHYSIVSHSDCPQAPIQLAVEATLPQFHFICFLNFFVGLERQIDCNKGDQAVRS